LIADDAKSLLLDKLALINQIKDVTEAVPIVDENSAQDYIDMVNKREDLINGLKDIDKRLKEFPDLSIYSESLQIADALSLAIEADSRLTRNIGQVLEPLKKNMKSIKEQQHINSAYSSYLSAGIGSFYDRRN
jgi:hypothetical protein